MILMNLLLGSKIYQKWALEATESVTTLLIHQSSNASSAQWSIVHKPWILTCLSYDNTEVIATHRTTVIAHFALSVFLWLCTWLLLRIVVQTTCWRFTAYLWNAHRSTLLLLNWCFLEYHCEPISSSRVLCIPGSRFRQCPTSCWLCTQST